MGQEPMEGPQKAQASNEADQIEREIEQEEDELDTRAMSFRDKLLLLWLLREKFYGWLWLFFLMGLSVVFFIVAIYCQKR